MLITLLSFCTLFNSKSPCLIVDCMGMGDGKGQSALLVAMVMLYLIQEVLAVWSIGFNNPAHFINPTVQASRGNEFG
jgi:hypothetical protein